MLNSIVVIQARTNSSRLPAKSLLPISGIPIVVLAAKRAANLGRKVIVATSNDSSDDYLASVVQLHNISCYRGSLNNVLDRFTEALKGYSDEINVIRLTADNILPDGFLLDELENDFNKRNIKYLVCNGIHSGLPYGLGAEITKLRYIREAKENSSNKKDIEHVTHYIKKKFGDVYFDKYSDKQMGDYRCTIDSLDDYLDMQFLFNGVSDPVNESSINLIMKLKNFQNNNTKISTGKFVLGTAQLGMNYGIANKNGQPDEKTSIDIIKTSIENGIKYFDTASGYGESERVIGSILHNRWHNRVKIISKIPPMSNFIKNITKKICDLYVDANLYKTLYLLQTNQIDTMLLHSESDLKLCDGQILKRLVFHKQDGKIDKIGVSVQSPEELMRSLHVNEIEHIQLPINILDWRWDELSNEILKTKQQRDLKIHARSVFLQGLLIDESNDSWSKANVQETLKTKNWIKKMANEFNRDSIKDLCISYVNGLNWVDSLVIGVENLSQLNENFLLFNNKPLDKEQIDYMKETRPNLKISSLNPSLWIN
jgi:spore coat polysaccharide biosynthesis protein SpsF (cytidylyltransferase family)/aryl-alcohol dehydrogenase-like predicted oxidoreductase